ncbi:MAG: hypothetical protein C5B50_10840 [Verrucomicrobia bacterium]|nr:MAG: hypothetical protein C5B50_10840 [Verrucomicrobiota bacterium]
MNRPERTSATAFTVIELLVTIGILLLLAAIFLPAFAKHRSRAPMTSCKMNLSSVAKAMDSWAADHNGNYPNQVPMTNGGTKELVGTGQAFRHFLVLSNYLQTPKVLFCPSDQAIGRQIATTFTNNPNLKGTRPFTNDSSLSYFLNLDLSRGSVYPDMFILGDRNITNSAGIRRGVLTLTPNQAVWWTSEMHGKVGNIFLADGSIQGASSSGLQRIVNGVGTNVRLAVP